MATSFATSGLLQSRNRKNRGDHDRAGRVAKRPRCTSESSQTQLQHLIQQSALPLYYPHVSSLRSYVLAKLPASSRSRKRRILACGNASSRDSAPRPADGPGSVLGPQASSAQQAQLATLLDTTVVGHFDNDAPGGDDEDLAREWENFSQKVRSTGVTGASSLASPSVPQSDVRSFQVEGANRFTAIWSSVSLMERRLLTLLYGVSSALIIAMYALRRIYCAMGTECLIVFPISPNACVPTRTSKDLKPKSGTTSCASWAKMARRSCEIFSCTAAPLR